jgi:hypothetical protein
MEIVIDKYQDKPPIDSLLLEYINKKYKEDYSIKDVVITEGAIEERGDDIYFHYEIKPTNPYVTSRIYNVTLLKLNNKGIPNIQPTISNSSSSTSPFYLSKSNNKTNVTRLDIKIPISSFYFKAKREENYALFKYLAKPILTNGEITDLGYVDLTLDSALKTKLINYFFESHHEKWDKSEYGIHLDGCYQERSLWVEDGVLLRIVVIPPNGYRPCGIMYLLECNKYFNNVIFNLTNDHSRTIRLFNETIECFSDTLIRITGEDTKPNLPSEGILIKYAYYGYSYIMHSKKNMGAYYHIDKNCFYLSKVNNPHLQLMPWNQITYSLSGYPINKVFPDRLIVNIGVDKTTIIDELSKLIKIRLPSEDEGLLVEESIHRQKGSTNTYKRFRLTVSFGLAAILFEKASYIDVYAF